MQRREANAVDGVDRVGKIQKLIMVVEEASKKH